MPLVFATGAGTESGHAYADVLGDSYEYPLQYQKLVRPGEVFVYYRGARNPAGRGRREPVYLGCGVVGVVSASATEGNLVCGIEEFEPFHSLISFRDPDGGYLERGGNRSGYWQPGVRKIPVQEWERIVALGLPDIATPDNAAVATDYAAPELAAAVERASRAAVVAMLTERDDVISVVEMAQNNPGYDIRAVTSSGPLYVEVKGTRSAQPAFFLTESERMFAEAHSENYLLAVVTGVKVETGEWSSIRELPDAPTAQNAQLRVQQWKGLLP